MLWVTLALNWIVAAAKVTFGMATQCMTIVADGIHSFSDGLTNIIGLVGITIAGKPADEEHPYGHRKYETFVTVVIALVLFLASFGILREGIAGFFVDRRPEVNLTSFIVMAVTLVVNIFTVLFERARGKELKSDLLVTDSWHTLTDVFVTLSVFAALFGIGLGIPRVDSVFSILIAGVIVWTAFRILKHSSDVLCDRAIIEKSEIERIVRGVEGVRDCHEIRTRGRVDDVYVDLHVLVDSQMPVVEAHHLANIIEKKIRDGILGVTDVVVHIEPLSHEHDGLVENR